MYERALSIDEVALGSAHPYLAHDLLGIGIAHLELGRRGKAVASLERALSVTTGDPALRARIQFALAKALWPKRKNRDRARALAEEARDGFDAAPGVSADERAELQRWLAVRVGRGL